MIIDYQNKSRLWLSIGIAISVIALGIYYRKQIIHTIWNIQLHWAFAGFCFYLVNYALRAWRFYFISQHRVRWWPEGLYASSAHGFATYIIPFRAGDLALPLILRSVTSLSLLQGTQILVKARLMDVKALGIWIVIAGISIDFPMSIPLRLAWLASGIILSLIPKALTCIQYSRILLRFEFMRKIGSLMYEDQEPRHAFGLSIAIWAAIGCCYFCAARAVGLSLTPMQIWLLITIQLPLQLLPVQGLAGTGSHEGGWVAALTLMGYPLSAAVEYSLTSHIIIVFYVLTLGPAAIFFNHFCRNNRHENS